MIAGSLAQLVGFREACNSGFKVSQHAAQVAEHPGYGEIAPRQNEIIIRPVQVFINGGRRFRVSRETGYEPERAGRQHVIKVIGN